jgi:hypothetical protein
MADWDASVEKLLQKYADESQTNEFLHRRSYYRYKTLTTWFNMPIIVLSALSGSLQFLSKGYPKIEQYIVTGTASLSILTAILSATSSYLKIGESMSKHEAASNAWLLFYNNLKHQLALARPLRENATEFLADVKNQYDRLFELSPICSSAMIATTKKTIAVNASAFFETPTYLNGFKHTVVYGADRADSSSDDEKYETNSV